MTMDKDFFIGIWGPRGQVIAITLIFVTLNKQHVCIRIGTRKVIMTKNYNHMINNRTYKFQNTHFLQTIFTCSSNFNVWLWLKMMCFFPLYSTGKNWNKNMTKSRVTDTICVEMLVHIDAFGY